MLRVFVRPVAIAGLVWLSVALASAQAPRAITFQAQLKSSTGQLITNLAQPITLTLYDAATNGITVYSESQTVSVRNGFFTTTIGNANPGAFATVPFNKPYWVGVKAGTDAEMKPRLPLAAVPYALTVGPDSVGSAQLVLDRLSLSKVSGGAMSTAGTNSGIGINIAVPSATLDVNGNVKIHGGNVLEFGAGIAGKEQNAGKIGYGTFTVDTLDIVGAGNVPSERRIKFHAEGGASFSGNVGVAGSETVGGNAAIGGNMTVSGFTNMVGALGIGNITPLATLHVKGNQNVMILEGADHAYIEFYPRGFYNGRKAYIGFPSAGSQDFEIANEDGGVLRVRGTFVNNSDARDKTDITPLSGALDDVMRLRGVSYDWRRDLHLPEQRQIGFIAQDVEKVLPELVYTGNKGEKSVAYTSVIPVLVEAIKEQQKQIAALKDEVERLKH